MLLNPVLAPEGLEYIPAPRLHSEFNFILAERPIYIPGSGPPLAPVTMRPAHDKDGIIVANFVVGNHPRYIVSYAKQPHLRVSVAPENILDWVSPRTFEAYESEQTRLAEQAAFTQAKVKEDPGHGESRGEEEPKKKGKPGRKRKHPIVAEEDAAIESSTSMDMVKPSPRGRPRKSIEAAPVFVLPQKPTLTSPSKQRGLAVMVQSETDEEEEYDEEPTELAIEAQLQSTMTRRRSRPATEVSSTSPEPAEIIKPLKASLKQGSVGASSKSRSVSRQIDSSRQSRDVSMSSGTGNDTKRQRRPTRDDSVASISSRQVQSVFKEIEQEKARRSKSATSSQSQKSSRPNKLKSPSKIEPSSFYAPSSSVPRSTPKQKKKGPSPEPAEEEDHEVEYEIDEIVADDVRTEGKRGKTVVYYLIKWIGDYPNSWEPFENVGEDAIEEYQEKKRRRHIETSKRKKSDAMNLDSDSNTKSKADVRASRDVEGSDEENENDDDNSDADSVTIVRTHSAAKGSSSKQPAKRVMNTNGDEDTSEYDN